MLKTIVNFGQAGTTLGFLLSDGAGLDAGHAAEGVLLVIALDHDEGIPVAEHLHDVFFVVLCLGRC